jgi:hypothetical protein
VVTVLATLDGARNHLQHRLALKVSIKIDSVDGGSFPSMRPFSISICEEIKAWNPTDRRDGNHQHLGPVVKVYCKTNYSGSWIPCHEAGVQRDTLKTTWPGKATDVKFKGGWDRTYLSLLVHSYALEVWHIYLPSTLV